MPSNTAIRQERLVSTRNVERRIKDAKESSEWFNCTYLNGQPDEHDGLSPTVRLYSRILTSLNCTFLEEELLLLLLLLDKEEEEECCLFSKEPIIGRSYLSDSIVLDVFSLAFAMVFLFFWDVQQIREWKDNKNNLISHSFSYANNNELHVILTLAF